MSEQMVWCPFSLQYVELDSERGAAAAAMNAYIDAQDAMHEDYAMQGMLHACRCDQCEAARDTLDECPF